MGFSFSPWYRNLTVAQSAGRLVLRVRNAVAGENGLQPQLETSACLTPEHVQTAVAVCTIPETRLFVDGAQRGRVRYNRFTTVADRLLHWSAQPILEAALLILAAIAYLFAYFSLLRPLGVSGWREVGAATLAALTLAAAVVLPLLVPA